MIFPQSVYERDRLPGPFPLLGILDGIRDRTVKRSEQRAPSFVGFPTLMTGVRDTQS